MRKFGYVAFVDRDLKHNCIKKLNIIQIKLRNVAVAQAKLHQPFCGRFLDILDRDTYYVSEKYSHNDEFFGQYNVFLLQINIKLSFKSNFDCKCELAITKIAKNKTNYVQTARGEKKCTLSKIKIAAIAP
jgi:hypothetical protein